MADLNGLVLFARIVEAGSLSEAARRIQMPVSTVSRRLFQLEAELGVRLIERSTRRLRLTEIGTEVLEQARRGLEISEAVDSVVSNSDSEARGTLRLSAPPSLSDRLLAPLIGAFQAEYPLVHVDVFVTERMVDPIAEGIDVALRFGRLADSTLVVRPLLRYRHLMLASPAYAEKRPFPTHPDGLTEHRLLAFLHPARQANWSLRRGQTWKSVTFRPSIAMNDYAGLTAALVAGAGIGELPALIALDLIAEGRLLPVMPDWQFETLELSMLHLGNRQIASPVRAFKSFAVQAVPLLFPKLAA